MEALLFGEDALINAERDMGLDHPLVQQLRVRIEKDSKGVYK